MRSSAWPQSRRRNETGSCSTWSLTAASSPAPGEEQGSDLELLGFVPLGSQLVSLRARIPGDGVAELPAHIYLVLLERRRKDECHQGGDPGGDIGQVTQNGCFHPGCPHSSLPTPGDGCCHPPCVLLGAVPFLGSVQGFGERFSRREMQDARDGSGRGRI